MKRNEIFERLDPPPLGVAKLRERLAAHERRSAGRARIALVAVPTALALAAAVLLLVLTRPRVPDLVAAARSRGDLDGVALGLSDARQVSVSLAPERQATAGLVAVQTENPNVVFYWVASTE
jgi:hypothetical protein